MRSFLEGAGLKHTSILAKVRACSHLGQHAMGSSPAGSNCSGRGKQAWDVSAQAAPCHHHGVGSAQLMLLAVQSPLPLQAVDTSCPVAHNGRAAAQIENRQGLENFGEILGSADGIILSRGNLGLDVAAEKMAMVQKVGLACRCKPDPCVRLEGGSQQGPLLLRGGVFQLGMTLPGPLPRVRRLFGWPGARDSAGRSCMACCLGAGGSAKQPAQGCCAQAHALPCRLTNALAGLVPLPAGPHALLRAVCHRPVQRLRAACVDHQSGARPGLPLDCTTRLLAHRCHVVCACKPAKRGAGRGRRLLARPAVPAELGCTAAAAGWPVASWAEAVAAERRWTPWSLRRGVRGGPPRPCQLTTGSLGPVLRRCTSAALHRAHMPLQAADKPSHTSLVLACPPSICRACACRRQLHLRTRPEPSSVVPLLGSWNGGKSRPAGACPGLGPGCATSSMLVTGADTTHVTEAMLGSSQQRCRGAVPGCSWGAAAGLRQPT